MVQPHQPDELFPWLAAVVSARGALACRAVRFDATGQLDFEMAGPDGEVCEVILRPAALDRGREGTGARVAEVRGASAVARHLAEAAAAQVEERLRRLLERRHFPLLEGRNREVREVALGAETLPSLFGETLRPGVTRCGPYRLERIAYVAPAALLVFIAPRGTTTLELRRAADVGEGSLVGTYGPFALVVPPGTGQTAELPTLERFVGYCLALGTHDEMTLAPADGDADDPTGGGGPLGDKANPFLSDAISCGGVVMTAMFASRGRVVPVLHADRECVGFASYLTGVTETSYLSQAGLRPSRGYLQRMRLVDTSELDAIMTGCQAKLTALVEETAAEQDPELLVVMGTCVSRVIGDDVATAIAESGVEDRGIPTLWLETTATERDQHHRILWRRLVELFQAPRSEGAVSPSVNLLGYGSWRDRRIGELRELLGLVGIGLNAAVIPTFDVAELERLGDADVNLVLPSPYIRDSLLWATEELRAPTLEAPAPHGFAGTLAWLNGVLAFFDRPALTEQWVTERFGAEQERWTELRQRGKGTRVGVVLTSDHFGSEEPMSRGGVPWLSVLQEMGLGLDVLVIPAPTRARDAETEREAVGAALHVLGDGGGHTVTFVESPRELRAAMVESPCQLFYSEVPIDRRVTSAGKTPIAHPDFDMGFHGACRTLERLLRFARAPFFERYGRYLGEGGEPS